MSNAYIIHTDFDEIMAEISKLQEVDKKVVDEVTSFVNSLRELTFKVEPAMKRESHEDERQLWKEYQQLQQEKRAFRLVSRVRIHAGNRSGTQF